MAQKNQLTTSDYLPYDELTRLLKSLHKDQKYIWELYVRISFCTALRVSDVLSLTWAEVINRGSIVKQEQKTGKTRKITLNYSTQMKFLELYGLLGKPNPAELIFCNRHTKAPISVQYINRTLKTWKKLYGLTIEHFSTHTFRKTFGRYVYNISSNKSEALILLNTILKHSSIDITKVYIGLRDEEIQSVYSSISI